MLIESITVFDELDATQDSATTDVNYTSGVKKPIDPEEIYPLEVITQTIKTTNSDISAARKTALVKKYQIEVDDKEYIAKVNLAEILLQKFGIEDETGAITNYLMSLEVQEPEGIDGKDLKAIYLMRAVLTDPVMLSIFTKKAPGTDFGVWFQNASNGTRQYDYEALRTEDKSKASQPLLIAVPYQAANTPKPKGSRFDNPEVTAITTFLYYLDSTIKMQEVPHLQFLIDSFEQLESKLFNDAKGEMEPELRNLFDKIKEIADCTDPKSKETQRTAYFATFKAAGAFNEGSAFRRMLARAIIHDQIQFDSGKANSNRYEQGTSYDSSIGFSGTAGDTSSHFKENMLDPAADGNMTLGIMGRKNCQRTTSLNTAEFAKSADYTVALIADLAKDFSKNSRTFIDVGGLCKLSNRQVASEFAKQLQTKKAPLKNLKGIIFYDDVSNTKKVLSIKEGKEVVVDLTTEMVTDSDENGSYFTYYDQSHSRGADIKQMNKARAHLTLDFTVSNNDYKQAIMRMRKIVDNSAKQSFSIAIPQSVREQIQADLHIKSETLTGNDVEQGIKDLVVRSLVSYSEKPGKGQKAFYEKMNSVLTSKISQERYDVPDILLKFDTEPLPKEEIKETLKAFFATQNITLTDAELNGHARELVERLAGQNALVELLDSGYRPPKEGTKREKEFPNLEGQARIMFSASHEILTQMDEDVLKLEKRIALINAKCKVAMSESDKELKDTRAKLNGGPEVLGSDENVDNLNVQWKAIRKMIEGIKLFFHRLTEGHFVKVKQDAIDFFDQQFDLSQIVGDEVSAQIDLEFTPSEYYAVHEDLLVQQQLNGLARASIEESAAQTLLVVHETVVSEAALVEKRMATEKELMVDEDLEAEQQAEVTKGALHAVVSEETIDAGAQPCVTTDYKKPQ